MGVEKNTIAICANANMIGGVEEALVQLLRNIDYTQYSVDLYGSVNEFYADRIPNEVRIIDSYISLNQVVANLYVICDLVSLFAFV